MLSSSLDLKPKFSVLGALEQMIMLYKYQEHEAPVFMNNITAILEKVK